jgi:disulfide bond formation protein DsbB
VQRWPWAAASICFIVLLVGEHAGLDWVALVLAIVFAISLVLAFYHVGVEQRWFAGPTACTAPANGAMTLEQMKQQILGTAPVLCDRPAWALIGVSMAGWNLLASLIMAGAALPRCGKRSASGEGVRSVKFRAGQHDPRDVQWAPVLSARRSGA